jgi:hypothetical protein
MAFIHGFMIAAFSVVGASAPQQPAAPAGSNTGNQNRLREYEVAKDGTLPAFGTP